MNFLCPFRVDYFFYIVHWSLEGEGVLGGGSELARLTRRATIWEVEQAFAELQGHHMPGASFWNKNKQTLKLYSSFVTFCFEPYWSNWLYQLQWYWGPNNETLLSIGVLVLGLWWTQEDCCIGTKWRFLELYTSDWQMMNENYIDTQKKKMLSAF